MFHEWGTTSMWFQNKDKYTHSQQRRILALIKTSINYLRRNKRIKWRINLKFATSKNSNHFYFLSKMWCSSPCNIQERKTALSGMRVKGHGKSKDGRVSCRHPSERAGNNRTFLTHPGNIVWKRKAGKMWLSNDPSYILFTTPFWIDRDSLRGDSKQ